jgi:hypothetical protein
MTMCAWTRVIEQIGLDRVALRYEMLYEDVMRNIAGGGPSAGSELGR